MSRRRYFALCGLVLAGSFAGGYVASRAVPSVHAQMGSDMRGTSFTLVDARGNVQATLRGGAMGAELMLDDGQGKSRVEIGTSGIVVRDQDGRVAWRSPKSGIVPLTAVPN